MIRRLLLPLLVAVGVSVAAVGGGASPAAAVGWTLQNHPGGSWAFYYISPGANPQFCIGLGGRGDSPQGSAYHYIKMERSDGTRVIEYRDYAADGRNVCGPISAGTTRVRVGLYAAGGPSGVHHGYSYLFGSLYDRAYPWYCAGCWGSAPLTADPALDRLDQALLRVSRAGFPGGWQPQLPVPPVSGVYNLTAGRCTVRYGFLPLYDGGWAQMWSGQTNDCAWMAVAVFGWNCTVISDTASKAWPLNFTYLQAKAGNWSPSYVWALASDGLYERDVVLTATGAIL